MEKGHFYVLHKRTEGVHEFISDGLKKNIQR